MGASAEPVISVRDVSYRYEGDAPPALEHVSLTINPGEFVAHRGNVGLNLLVRCNGFILRSAPVNDHRLREFPRPIEHQGIIAPAIGKTEVTILETHGRAFVLNAKVPFPPPWGLRIRMSLAPLSPGFERSKKRLHARISRMGVELGGRMPAHQVLALEPEVLVPDGTPEGHDRLRVEFPAGMS